MIKYELEKSSDDHGYCLVQLIEKGTEIVRRTISRIWAVPSERHPRRQKVMYWSHGVEGTAALVGAMPVSRVDKYMRSYLGFD